MYNFIVAWAGQLAHLMLGEVQEMRKFLVILDDSRECLNAMRFAAMRAAKTGGGVEILAVIPPEEFNHWIGVSDIMRRKRVNA